MLGQHQEGVHEMLFRDLPSYLGYLHPSAVPIQNDPYRSVWGTGSIG